MSTSTNASRPSQNSLLLLNPHPRRLFYSSILLARQIRFISYPKSGRTWLRMSLRDLCIDPKFSHVDAAGRRRNHPDKICESIPKYFGKRIVLITRDPRDVVVSFYFHVTAHHGWEGTLKNFIRSDDYGFERILAFNRGWAGEQSRFADFMLVRYEDLKSDTAATLRRIVTFCGCPFVTDAQIGRAVERNAFEAMKEREMSGELNALYGRRFTPAGSDESSMRVRKGEVGGHRDHLDEEDIEFCDELLKQYDYAL